LGERRPCKAEAAGSIPAFSTRRSSGPPLYGWPGLVAYADERRGEIPEIEVRLLAKPPREEHGGCSLTGQSARLWPG
jgi:hypothetical protein